MAILYLYEKMAKKAMNVRVFHALDLATLGPLWWRYGGVMVALWWRYGGVMGALWGQGNTVMDLTKSIEELEGEFWPPPKLESHVAVESHRLRKVPLVNLTVEDLRLLVGQRVGLEYTVPLAMDRLEENPLAAGAMYRGDLLTNVLKLPESFWQLHPELNNRLVEVKLELEALAETIAKELLPSISTFEFR
ncbi:contact-dependent growth inhibition system immunity protein [Pokkaliibacter sp. MBI-7]|uniref:contact-dependent growth inhibition system immunity protein n=1 Tax=Pokkaliibacter sp. MBI-7 TaxID=3040600 RepID=UPI0024479018|nr:contact-dependent growth inhibition system immunity protein [Pokkaliibacter sp. MBI-7]MDH2434610.1 contact-dependent growth inhibition system immunity protein [Pokkaliibacter sp. MBI-7]